MASKMEEFRGKSPEELQGVIFALKRELFNLRFQQAAGELSNVARFREVRKDIARAKTALKQLALKSKKAA